MSCPNYDYYSILVNNTSTFLCSFCNVLYEDYHKIPDYFLKIKYLPKVTHIVMFPNEFLAISYM